jgi:hypothetical protein
MEEARKRQGGGAEKRLRAERRLGVERRLE